MPNILKLKYIIKNQYQTHQKTLTTHKKNIIQIKNLILIK